MGIQSHPSTASRHIFEDGDGELQVVENELVEQEIPEDEEAFVNKANDYQVLLPKNITEEAGIVFIG